MAERCLGAPGAFNGLVARAVARAGFDATYVSGAAVTASSGVPDVGVRGLEHFARVIREVADGSGLPLIADADTGFGEGEMVTRTVWEYHRAGAAGFHIEDQVFPKRCGHLEGKRLVAIDHFQEKVACAAAARDSIDGAAQTSGGTGVPPVQGSGAPGGTGVPPVERSGAPGGTGVPPVERSGAPGGTGVPPVQGRGSFIVCARTDARGVDGLDAAIERAGAYVDAGADMIFPEGLTSEEEFGRFAEAMRGRGPALSRRGGPFLLANMTEFGKTPILPVSRFDELGYDYVIFPVTTLRLAMKVVAEGLATLRRDGSAEALLDRMQTRQELYDLLDYTPGEEWRFPSPASESSDD